MLEQPIIQSRGFHNLECDGKIIGFQLKLRLNYYRGIYLSQLRPGNVTVDGVVFPREEIIWNVNGEDFTYAQMRTEGDVHWSPLDTATLKISKDGGLSQGYHEITTAYRYSSSYLPPQLQTNLDPDVDDVHEIPGFGNPRCTRRLLIV